MNRETDLPLACAVPPDDHPVVVEHLARRLVQIVAAALTDLDTVVSVHGDAAPTSAAHVRRHLAVVAAETLGCLEGWPS